MEHGATNRLTASSESIPIFTAVRSGAISPRDIECAQQTFNEEALYQALEAYAREWHALAGRPARVLEMCSASGLCSQRVSRAIPVETLTLVDTDANALATARRKLRSVRTRMIQDDAVTYRDDETFDLVLLNSAYHHIEDRKKSRFLRNVRRHLAPRGQVLIGDHFLRAYRSRQQFRNAVVDFYSQLLAELDARGEHRRGVEIVRQAAHQCWQGDTEFKVSWERFRSHVDAAGLKVARQHVVWQAARVDGHDDPVGSLAIMLTADPQRH